MPAAGLSAYPLVGQASNRRGTPSSVSSWRAGLGPFGSSIVPIRQGSFAAFAVGSQLQTRYPVRLSLGARYAEPGHHLGWCGPSFTAFGLHHGASRGVETRH